MKTLSDNLSKNLMLVIFLIGFVFFGCKEKFENEIKNHFNKMKYSEVSISEVDMSNQKLYKGGRNYKDSTGNTTMVKWAFLVNKENEIGGIFVGSEVQDNSTFVALTKNEVSDAVGWCVGNREGKSLKDCLDEVGWLLWFDCHTATTPAEKEKHCWYKKG